MIRLSGMSTLALAAALAACGAPEGSPNAEAPALPVGLGRAVVREYAVTVTALGTIVARPGMAARVAAPGESFVTAIFVAPGDRVDAGAPLVELDRSVWAEQAHQAEAALAAADEAYGRATRLVERGILAAKDLETATADRAQARAAAAEARRTLERAVLRAPIRGVVTAVAAAVSQPVTTADVLVEVVDSESFDALVQLTPATASAVSAGDSVMLSAGLDPASPFLGTGTVRGVSSAVAPTSGTVLARVALANPASTARTGLTVAARIVVERRQGAVVVLRGAIVPVTEGVIVYVVDSDGVAHATPVELGPGDADSVQILSGLLGSERVVEAGAYGIVDGARVTSEGTR